MAEQVIMKATGVEITTKIARFGSISYQVANIGSVSVYTARKINLVAAILVLGGIAVGVFGGNLKGQAADQAQLFFAIAATLVIAGIILQMFWPKKEFTFVLKTSSNDVHKIVSENGEHLDALQSAIETAFIERA